MSAFGYSLFGQNYLFASPTQFLIYIFIFSIIFLSYVHTSLCIGELNQVQSLKVLKLFQRQKETNERRKKEMDTGHSISN